MPTWRTTPVDAVPTLSVRSWRLIRTELGEVHVVGYNLTEREGRVSSPILEFDVVTRTAITRSRRRYVLCGDPGEDADASYTFATWCRIMKVVRWSDVTKEILANGLPNTNVGQP